MTEQSSPTLVPKHLVCKMFNVCPRTVSRWSLNKELGFPPPTQINGRNYWDSKALEAFLSRISTAEAA